MLVAVQVSSMKTSRSGSRSSCPSNQSCLCFRTSGRSCSIAWPVFFCASCRDEQRSGEARPQRRSGRSRPGPRATPQARCPCALPRARECPPAAPRHGVIACRRLGVLGQYCRSCAAVPASGSPSMVRPQSELPQHGNSSPHQSPQEAGHANPTIKADPSMLASFTSTDSESENPPLGNPLRFRAVENRSSCRGAPACPARCGSLRLKVRAPFRDDARASPPKTALFLRAATCQVNQCR
jgi:hypothetical protein